VWNQFEATNRDFDREVDALSTLYQTATYAEADGKNSISENIERYLRHVILNYQIEHAIFRQRRKGEDILRDIGLSISSLANKGLIIDPLCSELFRNLNEARDGRGDRISNSRQRMPPTIWLVAIFSSLVWLVPFFALDFDNENIKRLLVSGVTFVILIFLVIIYDFDGPFDGTWKVSIDGWREFLEDFDPNPHIIFVFKHNDWLNDLLSRTFVGKRLDSPRCQLSTLDILVYPGLGLSMESREIIQTRSKQ
jgi:hypothetical protein